jgi:lipopolysaccharide export LptBFGC system permease protein LptF
MRKLDRYVALAFLGPFVLSVVAFSGLFVVIDLFVNIDEFDAGDSPWDTIWNTARFYLLRLPSFLADVMPMLSVLPAVVCMVRLERTNELVAMRAAGVSARRASLPVLACSAVVVILAALNQERVVPAAHQPLAEAERRARDEGKKVIKNGYIVDREGRLMMIGRFQPRHPLPTLSDVTFWWRDELGAQHETRAPRSFALDPAADTWYLEDDRDFAGRSERRHPTGQFSSAAVARLLRRYDAAPASSRPALMVGEPEPNRRQFEFGGYSLDRELWPVARHVVIIEPHETPSGAARPLSRRGGWLVIDAMVWVGDHWRVFGAVWRGTVPAEGATAPTDSGADMPPGYDPRTGRRLETRLPDGAPLRGTVEPDEIRRSGFKQMSSSLTIAELAELGDRFPSHRFRQRCWVTIWNRIALPFSNLVLALLAMPLVLRRSGPSAMLGIALAVVMSAAYLVTNIIVINLAYRGWPLLRWPPLAGVGPTAVFGIVGAWVFSRMDDV